MFFVFQLTRPADDYWGEFGAYGPCSRTCGTGVAMRTRKCITSRSDISTQGDRTGMIVSSVKGALCSFGEEIQTHIFYIFNSNEVTIQTHN